MAFRLVNGLDEFGSGFAVIQTSELSAFDIRVTDRKANNVLSRYMLLRTKSSFSALL
jgi:hypothetical protein